MKEALPGEGVCCTERGCVVKLEKGCQREMGNANGRDGVLKRKRMQLGEGLLKINRQC